MAINKKLIHFLTEANFNSLLAAGNILDTSICFIQDANKIWTHGTFYGISDVDLDNIEESIAELVDGKVDKVSGKGLSTNDFTTTLKNKLDGIASGAEVNVLSDWAETDSTKDSFIKNKPTLAKVATSGSYTDLSNRPTIDTALSTTSANAVLNKVITASINTKLNIEDAADTYATKEELGDVLSELQNQIDTLVGGDSSDAIESFNEIVAFLNGVEDTETIEGIIAGINTEIAKKADKSAAITNITRSGNTFTATRADGSTFTFTLKDNDTKYTFENGSSGNFTVTPSGGSALSVSIGKPATAGTADQANKLSTARAIDGVNFNGESAITHYGECSTVAATAEKAVSLANFTLVKGAKVAVKFTVTNSATNPTLNINDTGAKAIMYRGSAISAGYLAANRVYEFVYDGTDYELVGDINTDTNTKVTSASNHYAPTADSNSTLSVDASSTTPAKWGTTSLVTGVNLQRDSKGHVTGVTVDSIKMPSNPNSNTTYTFTGGTNKITVDPSNADPYDVTITPSISKNVTYTGTLADEQVATFEGTSGLIKASGYTIASSVPANAKFTDTTYSAATTSADGLMSASDKAKLDGIQSDADAVSFTQSLTSGTKVGTININGTGTDLYAPTNTNTTYSFAGGTNKFTVTPSGGAALEVTVTPSITNNVTYTGTLVDEQVATFEGTSGKVKASGYTIGKSVPSNAVFTDTIPSAYCSTAAATAAKAASCSGYTLTANTYLHLIVTTANTSKTALTLNVNGKGAKNLYINGSASSTSNYKLPAGSYIVYYDGTQYQLRTDGILPGKILSASNSDKVNGLTVQTAVPANAKFSDTTYSAGNGLTMSDTTMAVGAGTGISVAADTVSVKYGTEAGTAAQGNDSRLSDARNPKTNTLTNEDLNNITTTGFYAGGGSNTVANKPSGIDAFGLIVFKIANGYTTQELTEGNTNAGCRWTRQHTGSAWSSWVPMPTFGKTPVGGKVLIADGVTGKIKTTGFTIGKSVPSDAVFTDTKSFTITATATDDDVVVLTGTNGTNKVTFDAKHAQKGPASGYTSGNSTTSISGSGGTIKIPQITVDSYGHVTAAADESVTITMPSVPVTSVAGKTGAVTLAKGDVGLGNVTNESKSTMFTSAALTGTPTAPTATSGTNSTQIATTAFVLSAIDSKLAANDAMIFKGTIGSSGATVTALPNSHNAGWTYKVITAGTYAGVSCEIGDMIVCVKDGTAAANSDWTVILNNIDGAVTGPASSVDARVAVFNGTTGKVIKDSGYTIASSVPANAKFTDTHYTTGIVAGGSAATANAAVSNPYIAVKDDSTYRSQVQLKGGGATSISSDASGVITITSTDTNTKVTSVGNHYTPAEDTNAAISASNGSVTNITGTAGKLNVVTGLKRDAKGHIVGVTSANIYSTDNNTQYTAGNGLTLSGTTLNVGAGTGISVGGDTVGLATSGVTAGTYGDDEATRTLTHSDVFDVPQITVDAYGRVTSASTKTLTLPASGNTDTYTSAYCSTAAATAAKTATCTDYSLLSNSYLYITIVNSNTSKTALTLNVNGKGAKPIYINGSASSASNYTLPAGTYIVFYNGTNYYFRTDGIILGTAYNAISISDSGIYWGNNHINGSISPIDAAASYVHSANRLQFANPAGITVEYSRDGGATWVDYGLTNQQKIELVSGIGTSCVIGKRSSGVTTSDKLRITLNSTNMNFYTKAKSLLINVSTNGAEGSNVTIEKSMKGSGTTFTTWKPAQPISGWPGWNRIPLNCRWGGAANQTSNIDALRFTFGITSLSTTYNNLLSVIDFVLLGDTYWHYNHIMAKTGHLYSWDYAGNATFSAGITATSFSGSGASLTSLNASNISSGTIAADRLPDASTSAKGAMTAAMVTKLNGIATGATKVTTDTVSGWGYTKNAGTVTSITLKSGTGISLDSSNAITSSGTRTISLASGVLATGTAGTQYGPTAAVTGNNNSTINIPHLKVDTYGRVTSVGHYTLTLKNTTYSNMGAATASAAGTAGLVPAPAAGAQAKFLRGDGTWATPTNTTYGADRGISLASGKFGHSNTAITAGTVGTSTATSGSTISIPYVTYDSYGHITAAGTHTHTVSGFLTSHQTIKLDGITGATVNRYATCSTAAGTAAKTANITTGTFNLEAGARVSVKFSNANTAGTPTLNINSKGAKNIFHKGAQITTGSNKSLLAGIVDFIYDGTLWHLVGNYIDTTYSLSSLGIGNVKNYDQSKAIKGITRSNTTFTYTCLDGTTGTFTQQSDFVEITYANLKTLVNNSTLVPGCRYAITDYECTYILPISNVEMTVAAPDVKYIICTATSTNTLSEDVEYVRKDGYVRIIECKYDINPENVRWAAGMTTKVPKGAVYYMKDENGVECGYDFKHLKFRRWAVTDITPCTTPDDGATYPCSPYRAYMTNSAAAWSDDRLRIGSGSYDDAQLIEAIYSGKWANATEECTEIITKEYGSATEFTDEHVLRAVKPYKNTACPSVKYLAWSPNMHDSNAFKNWTSGKTIHHQAVVSTNANDYKDVYTFDCLGLDFSDMDCTGTTNPAIYNVSVYRVGQRKDVPLPNTCFIVSELCSQSSPYVFNVHIDAANNNTIMLHPTLFALTWSQFRESEIMKLENNLMIVLDTQNLDVLGTLALNIIIGRISDLKVFYELGGSVLFGGFLSIEVVRSKYLLWYGTGQYSKLTITTGSYTNMSNCYSYDTELEAFVDSSILSPMLYCHITSHTTGATFRAPYTKGCTIGGTGISIGKCQWGVELKYGCGAYKRYGDLLSGTVIPTYSFNTEAQYTTGATIPKCSDTQIPDMSYTTVYGAYGYGSKLLNLSNKEKEMLAESVPTELIWHGGHSDANGYWTVNYKQDSVVGSGVSGLVKLTQSEYDALTTKDDNTLYVIIE